MMKEGSAKTAGLLTIYWLPRVLGILLTLFVALFALDVFSEGYDVGETILALLIHLVPAFLVAFVLIMSWHRNGMGAILFFILALVYLLMSRWEGWILAGPLIVIGLLFSLNSYLHVKRPDK